MDLLINEIDELILETVSFFDPMTKEMIILDFNSRDIKNYSHFDINLLEQRLKALTKKKLIKTFKKDKETYFQRLMPRLSLFKRILRKIKIK